MALVNEKGFPGVVDLATESFSALKIAVWLLEIEIS